MDMRGDFLRNKRAVLQLLQDYTNYLPGGSGEAYVPVGSGGGDYGGWPLSPTQLKRMDKGTMIGQTYQALDEALDELRDQHPILWETMYRAYLQDDVGHSQVEYWRSVGGSSETQYSEFMDKLVDRHDEAIEWLAWRLDDVDLWVKYPSKAPGPMPGTPMQERHDELVVVYLRYRGQGLEPPVALEMAAEACDYSERRAWDIIKNRVSVEHR